jgi:hypothetical protein
MNPQTADTFGSSRAPERPNPAAAAASGDPGDFVVVFHRAETRLMSCELGELRRWLQSWSRADRPCYVVLGCCADTSREDRASRLQELVGQVVACGVPRDMIRYTDEWVAPPLAGEGTALPEDVVWLKAVDAMQADQGVTSVRGLFSVGARLGRPQ